MLDAYISSVLTDLHPEFTLSQRKETKTREAARINGMGTDHPSQEQTASAEAARTGLPHTGLFHSPTLSQLSYLGWQQLRVKYQNNSARNVKSGSSFKHLIGRYDFKSISYSRTSRNSLMAAQIYR